MTSYPRKAAALTAVVLATLALAAPARAQDPSASATGTVAIGIRSITVSPTTFHFGDCRNLRAESTGATLTLPNGWCDGPRLSVTNGEAPAHIHVRATDFEGTAGGPAWDLCDESSCTNGPNPGAEQARLFVFGGDIGDINHFLSNNDQCDPSWNPANPSPSERCAAAPSQSVQVFPRVIGPGSTSNGSPSFSTTITWTALP